MTRSVGDQPLARISAASELIPSYEILTRQPLVRRRDDVMGTMRFSHLHTSCSKCSKCSKFSYRARSRRLTLLARAGAIEGRQTCFRAFSTVRRGKAPFSSSSGSQQDVPKDYFYMKFI